MTIERIDTMAGTQLTYGTLSRADGNATRACCVVSLDGTNDNLKAAIDELNTSFGDTHPNDGNLYLKTISARYLSNSKVMLCAYYSPLTRRVDLSRSAKSQADRRTGVTSVEWWRDTSAYDSAGYPNGSILFYPYSSQTAEIDRRPRAKSLQLATMTVIMSTVLDSDPGASYLGMVGKINSNSDSQWLVTGGFPSKTLLFNGWDSQDLQNGYKLVTYSATYLEQTWLVMDPPVYNTSTPAWETTIRDRYETATFSSLPVHTVVT